VIEPYRPLAPGIYIHKEMGLLIEVFETAILWASVDCGHNRMYYMAVHKINEDWEYLGPL